MQGKASVLYVGSILVNKYRVTLLSRAYHNLDEIYEYIASELQFSEGAVNLIDKLEEAIFSLEKLPRRGVIRKVGAYGNKGYRQLFVNNFTIIYRIDEDKKQVIIVTVRYSKSQF